MDESEPHDTRRPYVAPRVDDLGTLEELTHGGSGAQQDVIEGGNPVGSI